MSVFVFCFSFASFSIAFSLLPLRFHAVLVVCLFFPPLFIVFPFLTFLFSMVLFLFLFTVILLLPPRFHAVIALCFFFLLLSLPSLLPSGFHTVLKSFFFPSFSQSFLYFLLFSCCPYTVLLSPLFIAISLLNPGSLGFGVTTTRAPTSIPECPGVLNPEGWLEYLPSVLYTRRRPGGRLDERGS